MEPNEKAGEVSAQAKRAIVRPRTRSKFALPSERFNFDTHFEVLRQFVVRTKHGSEPVATAAVEGGTIPVQAAGLNVRFLVSLGLLQEDEKAKGKYAPTPTAIKFVSTRSVSEEKARPIMRSVVEASWFGEFTRNWFATRPVTPEDEFVKELAIYSEVSDMAKKELALRTIVAYLTYAGTISRDTGGNLTMGTPPAPEPSTPVPVGPAMSSPRDTRAVLDAAAPEGPAGWHVIQTEDFYVKVRSDMDVLADLRAHLDLLDKKVARLKAKREDQEGP